MRAASRFRRSPRTPSGAAVRGKGDAALARSRAHVADAQRAGASVQPRRYAGSAPVDERQRAAATLPRAVAPYFSR